MYVLGGNKRIIFTKIHSTIINRIKSVAENNNSTTLNEWKQHDLKSYNNNTT
jgi:hypothetical protein